MRLAIEEAKRAASLGEVPVGAVVVHENEVVARAHNEVESSMDASAHAEVLAIRRASDKLGNWRLNDASLYVTLEPCTMCIGALILSRVSNLYFAADDARQGAVGSLYNLASHSELPHKIAVSRGILKDESEKLLTEFFTARRI